MKCSFSLVLLALLPALALAAPEPSPTTENGVQSLNPTDLSLHPLVQARAAFLTNGQRLARGLPPNRPRRARQARALQPRQSSTCVPQQGVVRVAAADPAAGTVGAGGYLSRLVNAFGEYGFTQDLAQAARISLCPGAGAATVDISINNAVEGFPNVGAVVGFSSASDDLSPASPNYVYIAATEQVPRGPAVPGANAFSTATGVPKHIESNIWQLGALDELLPSWVNTDGSVPAAQIAYTPSAEAFVLTGDVNVFRAAFGPAPVVHFFFDTTGSVTVPV